MTNGWIYKIFLINLKKSVCVKSLWKANDFQIKF